MVSDIKLHLSFLEFFFLFSQFISAEVYLFPCCSKKADSQPTLMSITFLVLLSLIYTSIVIISFYSFWVFFLVISLQVIELKA